MDVAALLKRTREESGLSQSQLASRAGTSQPAISRYEAGVASPSIETLDRLLASMGATLRLSVSGSPRGFDARTPRLMKLRAHRAAIRQAALRHHATNVRVFGSVARGQDGPGSDIDLLVDLDVRRHGLISVLELQDELSDLLGERVDVAPSAALAPHVAERAFAEAVAL